MRTLAPFIIASALACASAAQAPDKGTGHPQRPADDAKELREIRAEAETVRRLEASAKTDAQRDEVAARRVLLVKRLDAIGMRIDPRTRYVVLGRTDPATQAYSSSVAKRIEEYGTTNFPKRDGNSMYGKVVINVTIASSGALDRVEVVRSSGDKQLDQHAVAVVRRVAPFAPFDEPLRSEVDRIVLTFPFDYAHEPEKK